MLADVLRLCALALLTLAGACFETAPQIDESNLAIVLATCRSCQAESCEAYAMACSDAAGCDKCVEGPYEPVCLASDEYRPLAFCACDTCADDCSYTCPGGGDLCRQCQAQKCDNSACLADPTNECFVCIGDPYAEGCATNELFIALQECHCNECETECLWECPGAAPKCAGCLTASCGMPFTTCLSDDVCEACFNNPATDGCVGTPDTPGNELYAALGDCVCMNCVDGCGPLFGCPTP